MNAYLDTNIFDHIYKKVGCTGADIANLRKAIYGRNLSIPLGIHHLEEILLARKAPPHSLTAQIRLVLSIASLRSLIKPCEQLIADDIRAYAARGEADSPFIHGAMQNAVSDGIAELIESDGEEIAGDFVAALEESRRQKERFFAGLRRVGEIAAAAEPRAGVTESSFDEYWRAHAPRIAMALAERAGVLQECERRGIDGLLGLRTVRAAAGVALAMAFGQGHGAASGGPGGASEIHHVVAGAARAEIFVSEDAGVRSLIERIPLEGFSAIGMAGFLANVRG